MTPEFDEQWYLERYPDVAEAIAAGKCPSARVHYERFGSAEKREPGPSLEKSEEKPRKRSYQSFPGEVGSSASEEKFRCLKVGTFNGKSVLDVGCNEGFFCTKAAAGGATRVIGLDRNPDFITEARTRYAASGLDQDIVEFRCQTWDELPDEKFDIIFLLSALHYAKDQEALIRSLVDKLTPSGLLVLECGVINEERREFVKVRRAIDEAYFPTLGKLKEVLDSYAWKPMGSSVDQAGDPIPRKVIHIQRLKPTAILLLGNSYSGKTTLARRLQKYGIPCIMIDDYIRMRAAQTEADLDPRLVAALTNYFNPERLDQLYAKMREEGIIDLLFDDIINTMDQRGAPVSIVEGAVGGPDSAIRKMAVAMLEKRGYFVWLASSGAEL